MANECVSVIIPVHNAAQFLDDAFRSVLVAAKHCALPVEVSIYNDCSDDGSLEIIKSWEVQFNNAGISTRFKDNSTSVALGGTPSKYLGWETVQQDFNLSKNIDQIGASRNKAVMNSSGRYLCFFDADDIMLPRRIQSQLEESCKDENAIVGCRVKRIPEGSTQLFIDWANSLNDQELYTQKYLSFGPTVLMPTWFMPRTVYEMVAGFQEDRKGVPEDLIFFYNHLRGGGSLRIASEALLIYRYHESATTFSVPKETIRSLRLLEIERDVLSRWPHFTVWNAGKLGKRFFRSLTDESQRKVVAFCDIDEKKQDRKFYVPYPLPFKIPIITVQSALPPFIICVKTELVLDRHSTFHALLDQMKLKEGQDFFYFN